MAPRRAAVGPDQWPLVIATALMLVIGIALAVWLVVEVTAALHYPLVHNVVD